MSDFNESNYIGDIIAEEWHKDYTRQRFVAQGAIVRGQTVKTGTAATQKAPTVTTDTTATNGIALNDAADGQPVVCLVRGPSIAKDYGIVYPAGATDTQKAAHRSALLAAGILVTTQVV